MTSSSTKTTEGTGRAMNRSSVGRRRLPALPRNGALLALVAGLVIGTFAFGDHFASSENLGNIAVAASFLVIVGTGMTFVIVSGGIDLSVGSVMALSAVMGGWAAQSGSLAGAAAALGVCAAVGAVQGLLITRAGMPPFIVTLAGLLFARGLAQKIANEGNSIYGFKDGLALSWLGRGVVLGVPAPVLLAAIVALAGGLVLHRTAFGQRVLAIGGAENSAKLMGIAVERTKLQLYIVSATLAGVAGLVVATRQGSGQSSIQVGTELDVIAAVVIGGTLLTGGVGTVFGTACGVLFLQVLQNLINQVGTLSSYYQQVISGGFLVLVVAAQRLLSSRRSKQ